MSAVGFGTLIVAGAAWLYNELSVLDVAGKVYIQAGSAALMIIIGGLLLYYWIGAKPRTCDFMIATEGEMKKVNWPSRREVVGSTWVVICTVVLFAGLLFAADLIFSQFFQAIGVLETS